MSRVIIITSSIPWEWSADYVRQTAKRLSAKNLVYCFIWAEIRSIKELIVMRTFKPIFSKTTEGVVLFHPIHWIPLKRFETVVAINMFLSAVILRAKIMLDTRSILLRRVIFWTFDPLFFSVYKVFKGSFLLYDIVDHMVGSFRGKARQILQNLEFGLIKQADLVVANSHVLLEHARKIRSDVLLVPQGFDINAFARNTESGKVIFVEKNIIGFMGGLNHRLDYELLFDLIKRNPQWHFVFWGPVQGGDESVLLNVQKLRGFENVVMGESSRSELPGIITQFDVGIIPYDANQAFNRYCYPMKVFEYFYMGKPVVATPIEELKRLSKLVKIGRNAKEWEEIINKLLEKPWPIKFRKRQRKLAEENSWERKVGEILDIASTRFIAK